ncbi:MAG: Na+/H+ antiporter subunit E [Acholeplasmataceae bacterium]|nr:Na+/H+ antiporter subunit E [Acholeplasmataceae bacterium]
MKTILRLIALAAILTLIFLFYVDFKIEAHWVILIFLSFNLTFWLFTYFFNKNAFYQTIYMVELLVYFIKEMFVATYLVIKEVLSVKSRIKAGIIAMPLDVKSNIEITILASLISLTPGTLSLEVSEDKSFLFIHVINIPDGDAERIKSQIKNGFERRVQRIFN